MLPRK